MRPGATVLAVGDGDTDGPILREADVPYIMYWPGAGRSHLKRPEIHGLKELEATVQEIPGRP